MPSSTALTATFTHMATNANAGDVARLQSLLDCKLQDIPANHLPDITVHDILEQASKALHVSTLPPDLQLEFFLRIRNLINGDDGRPVKDETRQPLGITRAIFFYHLSEVYQFQRYHDTARWNLAFFTALLSTPTTVKMSTTLQPPSRHSTDKTDEITPAARRFMTSYLAAVMERHNTPTVFENREEFIRRWKDSNLDLFVSFKAGQVKLLRKAMQRLNVEWEAELDRVMRSMGRTQYDVCVAPFVGNIIPGRKDQGLPVVPRDDIRTFTRSASPSPEAMEEIQSSLEGGKELLEALRVPLEERQYQKTDEIIQEEETRTPVDVRYAITAMQNARPAEMLPALMRLFPFEKVKRESRWGGDLPVGIANVESNVDESR